MKCNHCGFENEQNFEYCVNCGAAATKNNTAVEAVSLNPAADIVMGALRDKLFLVVCILMTASCVLPLASSGMPLLNILITVFLWLTYADAQKGFANEKHLQFISGTVYAQYIIVNVASIVLLVCGVLFSVLFSFMVEDSDYVIEFTKQLERFGVDPANISQAIGHMLVRVMGGIFVFIGVIMLLFNILAMKKIHGFAKSVYTGIMYQNPNFYSPKTVKNWFIFIAVCCGITTASVAMNGAIVLLTNACTTATTIIVAILIDKYFVKQNF